MRANIVEVVSRQLKTQIIGRAKEVSSSLAFPWSVRRVQVRQTTKQVVVQRFGLTSDR